MSFRLRGMDQNTENTTTLETVLVGNEMILAKSLASVEFDTILFGSFERMLNYPSKGSSQLGSLMALAADQGSRAASFSRSEVVWDFQNVRMIFISRMVLIMSRFIVP